MGVGRQGVLVVVKGGKRNNRRRRRRRRVEREMRRKIWRSC
jgi:hypothetical protein